MLQNLIGCEQIIFKISGEVNEVCRGWSELNGLSRIESIKSAWVSRGASL